VDRDGHLVAVNESGGGPAPRFFLGRTAQGRLWWVRYDVDPAVADELRTLCEIDPSVSGLAADPGGAERFVAVLAREEC
jgi:hypothetical protein